jgi:hypothetical protein
MSAPDARVAPWRRPRCIGADEDQFIVVRGVICANQKSARSRSPASNWACEIIASPLRCLRRRSQAMGLSSALTPAQARGRVARGFSGLVDMRLGSLIVPEGGALR